MPHSPVEHPTLHPTPTCVTSRHSAGCHPGDGLRQPDVDAANHVAGLIQRHLAGEQQQRKVGGGDRVRCSVGMVVGRCVRRRRQGQGEGEWLADTCLAILCLCCVTTKVIYCAEHGTHNKRHRTPNPVHKALAGAPSHPWLPPPLQPHPPPPTPQQGAGATPSRCTPYACPPPLSCPLPPHHTRRPSFLPGPPPHPPPAHQALAAWWCRPPVPRPGGQGIHLLVGKLALEGGRKAAGVRLGVWVGVSGGRGRGEKGRAEVQ